MSLDDLLSQTLKPVQDDGFSARIALAMLRQRQKRQTVLLCLVAALLLPLLPILLPLAQAGASMAQFAMGAPYQPYLAAILGGTVAAWGLWPRPYRF